VLDGLPAREYVLSGHSSDVTDAIWSLDDLRVFSCSKEAIFEWEVGKSARIRENINKMSSYVSLAQSANGALVAARIDEEVVIIPGANSKAKSNLSIWDAGSNIEQSPKKVYLLDEVTRITATTNLPVDNSLQLIENVVIAGTNEVCDILWQKVHYILSSLAPLKL